MNNKRARNQVAQAAAETAAPQTRHTQVVVEQTAYQGQIPPPEILRGFDDLVPGTAAKLIKWAEDEQQHRHVMEREAQAANIALQQKQIAQATYQQQAVFRSDLLGQSLGFLVCCGCAAGAIFLGYNDKTASALALAAIPTAAVVQALRDNIFSKKS